MQRERTALRLGSCDLGKRSRGVSVEVLLLYPKTHSKGQASRDCRCRSILADVQLGDRRNGIWLDIPWIQA